jgi:hypothetical protein
VIGERTTEQTVSAGGSYLSTNDDRLLFYGPAAAQHGDVEITWPDGSISSTTIALNRHYDVLQGRDPAGAVP